MSATVAALNIKLGASTGALAGDLGKAQGMLSAFTAKNSAGGGALASAMGGGGSGAAAGGLGGMLAGLVSKINPVTAGLAGLTAAAAGATWATKIAADAQSMGVSFEVMLGSADKAKAMMSEIQAFAASTNFESPEIAAAAKSLLAFGIAQDQVLPSMRMLGDLSAGLNIPIGELSELYGKAKVQGRLFMEDINQLTGRGIPIIGALAKSLGVAEGDIRSMVTEGKIGFPQMQAALYDLTKEGSQFGGMMDKQSKTFWGQMSTLWDNIKIAVGGVGSTFIETLTEMLKVINAALDSWNKFWGNTPKGGGPKRELDQKVIEEGRKPMEDAKKATDEAAAAASKAMEKLKADGESLANSLRTPFEQIRDELKKAHELWNAGAISGETWSRAMAKAREDLEGQGRSAREISDRLRQQQGGPVAALQYGTQAAITAATNARNEERIRVETEKQQLAESRKTNELLSKILRETDNEPLRFNEVVM